MECEEEERIRIMSKKLSLVTCFIVGSLCFGQECPDQVFMDPNSIPFVYDPNTIPFDPVSGVRGILDYRIVTVGHQLTWEGWWCDPENNPATLTVSAGTLAFPTTNTFTWIMTPTSVTVIPITFTITDSPEEGQIAETRKGTLLVAAVPANKPPVLCGGRP